MIKSKRHIIYKKALAIAVNSPYFGLCYYLSYAMKYLKLYKEDVDPYTHMELYPEIYKHRPINARSHWFPIVETKLRKRILKQAIKETLK